MSPSRNLRRVPAALTFLLVAVPVALAGQGRPVTLSDLHRFKSVGDPQLSPDGAWVAYTVGSTDIRHDDDVSDIWMASFDGRTTLRLTSTPRESESMPRWSPDGRWLAFLSSRGDEDDADQLWLLNRQGGEAEQVTRIRNGISDYAWSPDGSRLVFVIEDGDSVEVADIMAGPPNQVSDSDPGHWDPEAPRDSASPDTRPPIVIDRFYFKEDYTGYVRRKRSHLYLFTLADRSLAQLTFGTADELLPSWSPDGQYLVFTSKRAGTDPDRGNNWDLFVIQAAPGAVARQLTTFTGPDADPSWEDRPAWSPDGRWIAYLQGGADSLLYYAGPRLAVIPWGGTAAPRLLTAALDRHVYGVQWAPDARTLSFRVEDDRAVYLARVPVEGGAVERLLDGRRVVLDYTQSRNGRLAALIESPDKPAEVYAVEGRAIRPLSAQNDSLLATLRLAPVEEITVRSKDGTSVNGFLVRPLDYAAGTKVPTILNIHGGPVSEYENDFNFYWQLLAANGYAVVAMNPRGSSGRGEKYALAIFADWGNKDAQDVIAGVDHAIRLGVADPNRLGVGGWSYGGILTNYVIAQDPRFKGATSGASISNILAGYGTDMYVREYEAELGPPWKNTQTWLKLSFPFLHADRIRTPTLFLCGEKDFNVPLLNSEQMYQALRSLGVPTRLIIYPDTWHGLGKPSYQTHRLDQYLKWYEQYVKLQ